EKKFVPKLSSTLSCSLLYWQDHKTRVLTCLLLRSMH
ncbi:unnamed protein product, partial [Brassica rapa]